MEMGLFASNTPAVGPITIPKVSSESYSGIIESDNHPKARSHS